MAVFECYYDFRSPFAYFAAMEMSAFERRVGGAAIWRPVSIFVLLNLQAGRDPWAEYVDPLHPVKRRYLLADVARGAALRNLTLRQPVSLNSENAMLVALAAQGMPGEAAFREKLFQALWVEQQDITEPAVLAACASELSKDGAGFVRAALTGNAKQCLAELSTAAFGKGIFGVPTFITGGEVFFGSDRMEALAWRLAQGKS